MHKSKLDSSVATACGVLLQWSLKEVLRRENQGLKVYAVDRSLVFSMTGTYFLFILSLLSGLIF